MLNKLYVITLSTCILLSQSPQEIKQAKQVIKKRGMSEEQVKSLAKQKGFSDAQIQSSINKNKIKDVEDATTSKNLNQNSNLIDLIPSNDVRSNNIETVSMEEVVYNDEKEVYEDGLNIESINKKNKNKLSHYGYDIFKRDPALFQASSVGVVNPEYLIGPGDEIIVMLWGETQFRQVLPVDREGFVFIPEIGQVFVNGLNLNLLESKLFRVFSQSYASLNPRGQSPTTFLDVSLGNLRPLRIQVLGEVGQPGAYTVSPSATLFSSLYYFNGPKTSGSLREIQLIRGGKLIASIDFYDYLLTGKKPKDEKLQLDDIIFIPRRLKTVSINGEVNRPAIYELKPDETFTDLIEIAGKLKVSAYLKRSQIDRVVPFEKRAELKMDRMFIDVKLDEIIKKELEFEIMDDDKINIFSISDLRQNVVELNGAVSRPGIYDLGDSLKLSDLIDKADGVLGDAYLERIDILRMNPDFSQKLIKVDLEEVLKDTTRNDITLRGQDIIRVYSISEMAQKSYVSISGHVKKPGRYFLHENMRLYDLVFAGGGMLDEDFIKSAYLKRADIIRLTDDNINSKIIMFDLGKLINSPESSENLNLKHRDEVKIYNKEVFIHSKPVTINGIVRKPGTYDFKLGMSLKDLILEAGGLEENIFRYRVEIARLDTLNQSPTDFAKIVNFNMDSKFSLFSLSDKSDDINKQLSEDKIDFKIHPYDLVSIRPDPYFVYQKKVAIKGEVLYPGEYVIINSNEKVTDLIKRAGGLRDNAYLLGSNYLRNGLKLNIDLEQILKNPKSKMNFRVQDGDELIINTTPNLVYMNGEVNSGGVHKFNSGKRLSYYLKLAGGLSPEADKKNIWITYPSGDSKKYNHRSILSPKVYDGSAIFVGKKKEEEPFNPTEFAKEITSIIANLAQAIAVVLIVRN